MHRLGIVVKLLSLLILVIAPSAAQTVEGAVINAVTGAGIVGAKVVLQQDGKAPYSTVTDASGQFRIDGVKDGAYSPFYSAERYFYSGGGPQGRPLVQIRAGDSPVRIEGRMIPLSRIAGRVIDSRGDPVVKARVELTSLSAFWEAYTDANGNFELGAAVPGDFHYALSATVPPDWKSPGPDPDTGQPRGWARTFYPGGNLREQAAPVTLRAGGDLLGLEIKILDVPLVAVRGELLQPDGRPAAKVSVGLWETGPRREAVAHAVSKTDGTFEFPAVTDGDWRLSAELESGGVDLRVNHWIEVKGREIEGVRLRLSAPFVLSGSVVLETRQGMRPPQPPDIVLVKQHNGQILFGGPSIFSVHPDANGRFRFQDVYPGTYRVVPGAPPPQFYLEGMRLGDGPLPEEVELFGEGSDLTISYRNNGGTVRGTVEQCGTGQVWLVPRDTPRNRIFFGACSSDRFEITAVRPGEYYALAVPGYELWSGNVDAVFLQKASRVTVRAGETTQADLTLATLR